MNNFSENTISVFRMICTYFVSLILFFAVQGVTYAIVLLVVSLLLSLPLIGSIVAFLFAIRKDGPICFSFFASCLIALSVTNLFIARFNKNNKPCLSKIHFSLSITFLIIGILSIIGSILNGDSFIDGICYLLISFYEYHTK